MVGKEEYSNLSIQQVSTWEEPLCNEQPPKLWPVPCLAPGTVAGTACGPWLPRSWTPLL